MICFIRKKGHANANVLTKHFMAFVQEKISSYNVLKEVVYMFTIVFLDYESISASVVQLTVHASIL